MAHLFKNITNSIWHAFYALQSNTSDTVAKSRLKVLTANIGTLMDLYNVEKGLDHYQSTSSLTFEQYLYYLQKEVFSSITDSASIQTLRTLEEGIDRICWLVCKKSYLERSHPVFEDNSVYQLFRIFCLLAETEMDALNSSYMVKMHGDEVAQVASHLVASLGLQWDSADYSALSEAIGMFRFSTFLAVLESKYSGGGDLDTIALTEAIDDLYQLYIENVIKKGYLMKKGFLLPTLRYFWFVLRPGELIYYKDSQQKDPSGLIQLHANCWADIVNIGKPDKKFMLSTPEHKCIELVAEDHKGRLQWLAALQIAIQYSGEKICYQRCLANHRRSLRQAVKQEKEETKLELQHERQARIAAESQAKRLEALSKEEEARVQELEVVKQKLEVLLQEEKQALRDEEIVRNLQARVLREEWERREQLEKLQQEQEELLESEKMKRLEFQRKQQENERQLEDAELHLQQLKVEKEHLDSELRVAREKIKRAEEAQILLETQIITRQGRGGDRVRRAHSYIPNVTEITLSLEEVENRKIVTQEK